MTRCSRVLVGVLLLPLAAGCAHTLHPAGAEPEEGEASYYAASLEGRPTASGAPYRGEELTCAHQTLAFGTRLEVTNLENGRTVEVVVNDRGPFVSGRIIDLSLAAARALDMVEQGVVTVRLRRLGPAP